ncbi:MAG: HlyD family efflux transporter periplasmic adaptor subunit [Pirellulales bacterium]|nr:HlyD family efflux transporter periplasmic adaptor subunit [Pirellulales bacterium]
MWPRIVALVIGVTFLAGLLVYSQLIHEPTRVSGFIEADDVRVGSRLGGRVAQVLVEEGQPVARGALLFELEPYDLQERLAQATAEHAARRAEYERLTTGFREEEKLQAKARVDQLSARLQELQNGPREQEIAAAQARLRLANAELELAQVQNKRVEALAKESAASRDELDTAVTRLRVALENQQVREQELAVLLEGTRAEEIEAAQAQLEEARQAWLLTTNGYRPEQIAEAQAAEQAAAAAVEVIREQLKELKVIAPVDGLVESIDLEPGDLVAPGAPVATLIDRSTLWVRAYVPENFLNIRVDQPVSISVDSFAGERFKGHISFIARQAEFTPGNVQTPEERSKQVFRIKATLDEGLDRLRPGMIADVWLEAPANKGS